MKTEPIWLSLDGVLAIHEWLLSEFGGAPRVRDKGLLEAALAAPRQRFHYGEADIFDLAAAYAHAITRNHPFADGNKRMALTAAGVFLYRNGHDLLASEQDAVRATVALSDRSWNQDDYAGWLRSSSKRSPSSRARKISTSRSKKK